MPTGTRPLHFVFKIGSRTKTIDFYQNILNMKALRHEEFDEGCNAACNGPYDGKWSKTMIGYGDEDNNFVLELTYNYGIRSYERGNDFNYVKVLSNTAIQNIQNKNYSHKITSDGFYELEDPNGYRFLVGENKVDSTRDLVTEVSLFVTNIERSNNYWVDVLKNELAARTDESLEIRFAVGNFKLVLLKADNVDHGKAYGRIAFSCPTDQLKPLQAEIESKNLTVLTKFISLDTPGKATVCVVILADPDGHEICYVGDEGFKDLSQVDPKAQELLNNAINADKSDSWHEKKLAKQQQQQQQQQQQK
jgi:catechol 2,3-dioxygenase-like lactoylglutathione lyase family enzyme